MLRSLLSLLGLRKVTDFQLGCFFFFFSSCKERSDEFQTLYVLELNLKSRCLLIFMISPRVCHCIYCRIGPVGAVLDKRSGVRLTTFLDVSFSHLKKSSRQASSGSPPASEAGVAWMACVGTCHPTTLSCRWRNCSWRGAWERVLSPPSALETFCGALGIKPGLTPCRGSKALGAPLFCKLLSLLFSVPVSPGLCLALSIHWS